MLGLSFVKVFQVSKFLNYILKISGLVIFLQLKEIELYRGAFLTFFWPVFNLTRVVILVSFEHLSSDRSKKRVF